jgi:hypothetical protein
MHDHHANIGLQLSVLTRNTAGRERDSQSSSQAIFISSYNTLCRVISSTYHLSALQSSNIPG